MTENVNNADSMGMDNQETDSTGIPWEFDFEGWTIGEDALYIQALAHAQRTGNYRPLFPHWARMIRHWPLAQDPRDIRNYTKLEDPFCREIIEQINQGIRFPKREDSRMGGAET